MNQISAHQRQIAEHTAKQFDVVKPPVSSFWDDRRESQIYILKAADRPQTGVTAYATVGLSEFPLFRNAVEFPTRAEVVGACASQYHDFERVLATIAFNVINSRWFCAPGVIFPGVIDMYGLSNTMNDVYFTYPFLWDGLTSEITVQDVRVAWLLAVPISTKETELARRLGPKALEDMFAADQIDIFDLGRPSIV